jgi:hypothetical protein
MIEARGTIDHQFVYAATQTGKDLNHCESTTVSRLSVLQ